MSRKVLILGATSAIAQALCGNLARRGYSLILTGRNAGELELIANDLRIRLQGESVVEPFDALDFAHHPAFIDRCIEHADGDLAGAILCYGYLTEQAGTESDFEQARRTIDVNFTSAVSVLNLLASYFETRNRGFIAAISSVAGDRGRASNYTYGAAKAGLSAYLQGLRGRLQKAGVRVLTIKPGFVDTPMTKGLLDPNSLLVASPDRVARDIDRAIHRGKDVLYTPWFWRGVMFVLRGMPEWLFKRLRF